MNKPLVIIKGAGDLATGVAHRLYQSGFSILMLEIPKPTVIRRTVAFAEAIYEGEYSVEGVMAVLANSFAEVEGVLKSERVAVLVDPSWEAILEFRPVAVIDAIIAKKNLGTTINDAPITIGLGPGFTAGIDVQAVVETQRGHFLGKVIYEGSAAPNTGEPGAVAGYSVERLLRAPIPGKFIGLKKIGTLVKQGEAVAKVGDQEIYASIDGVLRGILREGLCVTEGFKIGDIDPRAVKEHCYTISDKARSVAGGVLEAVQHLSLKGDN